LTIRTVSSPVTKIVLLIIYHQFIIIMFKYVLWEPFGREILYFFLKLRYLIVNFSRSMRMDGSKCELRGPLPPLNSQQQVYVLNFYH
jgi:hypothetical protein